LFRNRSLKNSAKKGTESANHRRLKQAAPKSPIAAMGEKLWGGDGKKFNDSRVKAARTIKARARRNFIANFYFQSCHKDKVNMPPFLSFFQKTLFVFLCWCIIAPLNDRPKKQISPPASY
jgi:hypothetical protein